MIEIAVYNTAGEQTGNIQVDEQLLGGEVRPDLLKQAFVRVHANRRQGSAKTKNRGEVQGSTKKLYKQKGTGNARRGDKKTNVLRGGGHGHAKRPHSFGKDMPRKMRQLANRNAVLAKLVDAEVKLIEGFGIDKPSTKGFKGLLDALKIDRTCLVAFQDTRDAAAVSARNIEDATPTQIDRLNAYDVLNHRYLLAEKEAFEAWIERVTATVKSKEVA